MNSGRDEQRRLDVEMVRRGLAPSRAQAVEAIEAGKVLVDGVIAAKAGLKVGSLTLIEATPAHPWVSRGGVKLAHALDVFGLGVSDKICLDVGASTGGFTDVLLARGARRVVAVDVGRGQLHAKLRADPRVRLLEETDARALRLDLIGGERPDLIVCDVSFIGVEKVLAAPLALAAPKAALVGLFKPQFQVGPLHIGKGGVVSDAHAIEAAAERLEAWLEAAGWPARRWTPSPIAGGDGNRERFFCCLAKEG